MDALKIKTLEEDNLFLLGQVQLLEARNRQLELRISQLSVSITFYLCWPTISAASVVPTGPARVRLRPGNTRGDMLMSPPCHPAFIHHSLTTQSEAVPSIGRYGYTSVEIAPTGRFGI